MKKLLTTVLVVLFAFGANAQIGAGIKVGANFANQDIEGFDTKSKTGYHFGAFFSFDFSENVSLQPEILFSKQGAEIDFGSPREVDYSYLTLPILLKYKILGVVNLHAGPQFNILSAAELEETANQAAEDIKDDLKSMDFAIALGGGVNLPAGLVAGLRYVISMSDINDGYQFGSTTAPEIKNKTLQIYLGYRLFGE